MPVTIDSIEAMLDELGIRQRTLEDDTITFGIGPCARYVRPDGDDFLLMVIELSEEGEYFKLFAPRAYQVRGPHVDAFLRATAIVQWKTKLLQFEYNPDDGEVRPIIEWPVEDGTVTSNQLGRSIAGLMGLIDQFHPVLERVLVDGVVAFPDDREETIARLETLVSKLKAEGQEPEGDDEPPN